MEFWFEFASTYSYPAAIRLNSKSFTLAALLDLMRDAYQASENELSHTSAALEFEKILFSIFIPNNKHAYGTRSTSVIFSTQNNEINFFERTYYEDEAQKDVVFEFCL